MATEERSKTEKPNRRRPSTKTSPAKQAQTIAELRRQVADLSQRENATNDVLRLIASSAKNLQQVLSAVAENAARLIGAQDAIIHQLDGDVLRDAAHYGLIPRTPDTTTPLNRDSVAGRAVVNRQLVHVHDILAESELEFPLAKSRSLRDGTRSVLGLPLLREGIPIGAILIRRTEVRPFSDTQIKLLKTFADQSVIAIEDARLFQELKESLEQQTATSEILGVIASSPTEIQPVLDVVAENAAKLCDATNAVIMRVVGDGFQRMAQFGDAPEPPGRHPITRGTAIGRAILDRRTIHVNDLLAQIDTEYPDARQLQQKTSVRTVLATPLLREEVSIGAILVLRREVRPFSDKQIKLLETFADQAVIAIENVRLFNELRERNAELREALDHQTATSEVLGIISRSPTDVQPVLDGVVESAAKVCGIDDVVLRLREGENMVPRAHFGSVPLGRVEINFDEPQIRWVHKHGVLHVPDARAQNEFTLVSARSFLVVPLRQQLELLGILVARRIEVRPFTPTQTKLLETFADQAVIAIENVRLFQELKELLEQQTATSEILGVIASSPTDLQPVLDVVAENAARLCDATDAVISRIDSDSRVRIIASYGTIPVPRELVQAFVVSRGTAAGRAFLDRKTIHVRDLAAEIETEFPDSKARQQLSGARTILATPMLREGLAIGTIVIRRTEVRPFSEKHIKLLETFASQAVIAIENVRLFQELQARTSELARSVGELKALGDVGQAVSSTLDLQTVLSTIVGHAVQLSGTSSGVIYEYDDSAQQFHLRASHRMEDELVEAIRAAPIRQGEGATGRATTTRTPVQVVNLLEERELGATRLRPIAARLGYRSVLAVPLLR
ncbi:MAG TPA: GAF domain-containing protein, partial [Candidatus Binatia bacterium]|nr:GAF domain-containing protein [Candidatus Binatia bacterium]